MESCLRFSVIVLVVGLSAIGYAEQPASFPKPNISVSEASDANLPAMPFLAEITSNDVYVRSGPGTNYYFCAKLQKGDKIKVVGSKFSWWQITPPGGSYAWISRQYVETDPQNSSTGTVIGEGVRVYAGSDEVQPMHSTTPLGKLNKGDKVALLGEEKEDYYKIAPPKGAYLWVSSQHARPLASLVPPVEPMPMSPPAGAPAFPTPTPKAETQAATGVEPNESKQPSVTEQRTKELNLLEEPFKAEQAKPLAEQKYDELKKALEVIANDKQSLFTARKAQYLIKTIERYELAQEIAKKTAAQDEQLAKTSERIEAAREEKLSQLDDKSIFAVIGLLKESSIFSETRGLKYYRIVDDEGKTICYARPAGEAAHRDLSALINKKVGLVGTIEASVELGGALVEFTNIIELK
ncbi:MAG: SH3 domain-containing protein [Planctomycetota bacterium]